MIKEKLRFNNKKEPDKSGQGHLQQLVDIVFNQRESKKLAYCVQV